MKVLSAACIAGGHSSLNMLIIPFSKPASAQEILFVTEMSLHIFVLMGIC